MISEPYLDPLAAAEDLCAFILDDTNTVTDLHALTLRLDALAYSLRFVIIDDVAYIPETDEEPSGLDHSELRSRIERRFPMLGRYWTALYSKLESVRPAEIAAGDAINDLTDIAAELEDVRWYLDRHGRNEALAALRWRYEHHLWMHVWPLRTHLEEVEFIG